MVKIKVEQGWLEGAKLNTCVGNVQYYSFKGIPYALPPLGKLRFKAPQPPVPWDGVRSATEHGANCPQKNIFTKTIIPGDEDCLHLNVYTPDLKPARPLAVMFYIHGGGYQSGSGDVTHLGPDFLVQHGVVVVTINYRLGPLGFLCLDTRDVPGNAGLKDQVAALKWVQRNIANFGGDPDNVTVIGQSAGGASTMLHVLSPMSKGLFRRAIPMSGVPSCDWSLAYEPTKRAFQLGKQLGFTTNDPDKLLDFLQSLPADRFIGSNPYILTNEIKVDNIGKFYHYTPVIEKSFGQDQFIADSYNEMLEKGDFNDVDILFGYTNSESLVAVPAMEAQLFNDFDTYHELFTPRKILNERNPGYCLEVGEKIMRHYLGQKQNVNAESLKEFVQYLNDNVFGFHIQYFVNNLFKTKKARTYFYKFSCYSKRNLYGQFGEKYGITGAAHLDDLVYLFDPKYASLQLEKSSKELKLVKLVCSLFTNFAKYGNPTPDGSDGVLWPTYDPETRACGILTDQLSITADEDLDAVRYWTAVYEDARVDPLKLFY